MTWHGVAVFVGGYGCGALATLIVAVFSWRKQAREYQEMLDAYSEQVDIAYTCGLEDGRRGGVH